MDQQPPERDADTNPLPGDAAPARPAEAALPHLAGAAVPADARPALACMAQGPGAPHLAAAASLIKARRAKGKPARQAKAPSARAGKAEFLRRIAQLPKRGPARSTFYELPFAQVANGLGLPYESALAVFSNGRAFSQIGEEHAALLMGFDLHPHKDVRGTDGSRPDPSSPGAKLLVSVKSAAKTRVKFQLSSQTGAGRSCDEAQLLASIALASSIVVVDVRHLPRVRITEFPAACAADWVRAKLLTPAGMAAERFYLACGASCERVDQGAHDFSAEMAALALANGKAEALHLASMPPAPADPFHPPAGVVGVAKRARPTCAKPRGSRR